MSKTCLSLVVAACVTVAGCKVVSSPSGGVKPSEWAESEREKLALQSLIYDFPKPLAESRRGMIAATTGPIAIHAGRMVLERGGTAADAAVAVSLAQIVLSGGSWNSFAGLMYMVYFDAHTGRVYSLNGGYNTVANEREPLTIPAAPRPSGRTALVPGYMAGIQAAHDRFGRMPFDALFAPAIELAEDGFLVDSVLGALIEYRKDVLSRLPEARAVFMKPDGRMYRKGDLFRQPRVAETLRRVARDGAQYMYTGAWAEKLAAAVQAEGGKLTLDDLGSYRADWSEPLHAAYRGFDVATVGLPEIGAVQLVEAMNMLDLAELNTQVHYSRDAESLHRFIQIARFGHIVSYLVPSEPRVGPTAAASAPNAYSPRQRITRDFAKAQWELLQKPDWQTTLYASLVPNPPANDAAQSPGHSDGIVVVDTYGNVAAMVHSCNAISWGTTGIFVDGVSIPDSASFQQDRIAKVGPGVRFPNITNPAIVLREGRPVLASSCIGSALHECTLQNLVNVVDFGMDPKQSVEMPCFWGPAWSVGGGADDFNSQSASQGDFAADVLEGVRKRGQPIKELPLAEQSLRNSHWVGIQIDPANKRLRGAVSPKLNGSAEGF